MFARAEAAAAVVAGALVVLAGYWLYKKAGAIGGALAAPGALNPASPDNLANQAANDAFHAMGGNPTDSIGTAVRGWWEDVTGQTYDPNASTPKPAPNLSTDAALGGGVFDVLGGGGMTIPEQTQAVYDAGVTNGQYPGIGLGL